MTMTLKALTKNKKGRVTKNIKKLFVNLHT